MLEPSFTAIPAENAHAAQDVVIYLRAIVHRSNAPEHAPSRNSMLYQSQLLAHPKR